MNKRKLAEYASNVLLGYALVIFGTNVLNVGIGYATNPIQAALSLHVIAVVIGSWFSMVLLLLVGAWFASRS